ncbi:PAS domain S-box [Dehalogenimonas alkenigignens]|uniref:PAS domain S-box n=1 Tax=Dehalogenimonas alkenigignens TaxID=1217799 RepID=A0A0W0GIB4_9CHLR|nr:PAS domain S-box protein [Dehalogenimonas alkenigignens]KTB48310.1 PAS domain S-box [Dehalogenimonas alkenigignens]
MEDKYFYRQIVDEIPLPLYVFQDGELKFINQAFVDFSGYSRDEISKMLFIDLIHPEDKDDVIRMTKLALSGKLDNLPQEPEFRIVRKDGEVKLVRIRPRLIEHNCQPAILGVARENFPSTRTH